MKRRGRDKKKGREGRRFQARMGLVSDELFQAHTVMVDLAKVVDKREVRRS